MASVRCPGCGAKNPEGAVKCRLCAYDLRGQAEMPMSKPTPGSSQLRQGSLKVPLLLAILAVAAIVLAGVLLGILPGGDVITDIRNKVPAIAAQSPDGWEEFTEPAADFKASLPTNRTEQASPFPVPLEGTASAWVSTLGPEDDPDTTLAISWAEIPVDATQSPEATLSSQAIAWAAELGGEVSDSNQTSFQGQPALLAQIEGLRNGSGDLVTVRALLVQRGDVLYAIQSRSIYADHPQFDRLVNGFALL